MIASEIREKYQVVIGLEVHAQLATESKIFSPDPNAFGSEPNTNIHVISLGHPGVMPLLNKKAVEYAVMMGIATGCEITRFGFFDRKNYFYPDLPKGYQITQDKTPICTKGSLEVELKDGSLFKVLINRIHLEEDAGKLIHLNNEKDSLVDLNRAGVPLIEIVTEPCIHSSKAASAFLTEIRKIVRYLHICDGNMDEGSLRCDANVSVMLKDAKEFGKKVEVKNMNSIKNVAKAIEHEVERQIELLEDGDEIISETRTYDVTTGKTYGMRTKEELNDYRYFPEPDLSPLEISDEWLNQIKSKISILPNELRIELETQYGLAPEDAIQLTAQKDYGLYYKEICKYTDNYKSAANWFMGPIKTYVKEKGISLSEFPLSHQQIADLIALIGGGKVSYSAASQQLFPYLLKHPEESIEEAVGHLNIGLESDSGSIQSTIDEVIAASPDKVKAYNNGKKGLIGMFMGEVMKKTNGKVDPQLANKLLKETLEKKHEKIK
ncbi:MAG: Asp-tRNA(Asn)/Glu-tRNA(Gln) amidotransferase subunit GatB [Bacteroidota bacterium]